MNRNGTTRFRNRLQQIIEDAQPALDYGQKIYMLDHRNKIRTKANDAARTQEKIIVHCNAFDQPHGRLQSASFR